MEYQSKFTFYTKVNLTFHYVGSYLYSGAFGHSRTAGHYTVYIVATLYSLHLDSVYSGALHCVYVYVYTTSVYTVYVYILLYLLH